jgi:hypothetical protein
LLSALGIGAIWFGYSLSYYGLTQLQGGRWGYLDLVWPARWTATKAQLPRDNGSHVAESSGTNAAGNVLWNFLPSAAAPAGGGVINPLNWGTLLTNKLFGWP